ncbi:hypothetical protein WJX72_006010 [[Myrmecia] bisecta]|uniref:Uncharacterized protein n=1 Tax=[Myrmecia] bisecta TaxID=41462 RepID=A0AAW1Q7I7_9CHLO
MSAGIAAAAIIIVVVSNFLCYVAHEKSLLHAKLRLPRLLFITNRAAWVDSKQLPNTYWAFDLLDPAHLVTSLWVPDQAVLTLRILTLVYWIVTLIVEGTTGDGFGDKPHEWPTFFTNWTFVLFGIWALMGIAVSSIRVFSRSPHERLKLADSSAPVSAAVGSDPEYAQNQDAVKAAALSKWTILDKAYCFVAETNVAATLFLSGFYWAFLYKGGPVAVDNVLKHGTNNIFTLLDVCMSRLPFVSYHYQVLLWYGTLYISFMWIYFGDSERWVYDVLDWNKSSSLVLYLLLPIFIFAAFLIWCSIAAVREALGRHVPKQHCVFGL